MATTTERDEANGGPTSYAEHDKLGPLASKQGPLHDPVELRAKLIAEFQATVAAAKDAAASVDRSAETAVHDSRKALRRGRAVLAMIARALPKNERRALRTALKDARRSLSMVRDHTVAPATLGSLQLEEGDRETAKRVLDSAAEALPPTAEIKQLLAEAATRAAAQAEALVASLPPSVDEDILFDGIATTYGEARYARRRAKSSKSWFHTWRRRTKELVYQLEFVAKHAGARASAIHEEIGGVSDSLGSAVDLIMLREFVETHGQGIDKGAVSQLRDAIDSNLDDAMKSARKAGSDVFSQKDKKFEKRLVKSVKRDLTTAEDKSDTDEIERAMD
ncbi:MAG: CHAD domain-containing protein [Myxococcota bacterium]|nr:CHAD domain-containing protein [Myxococcota bacterium]